MLYNKEIMSNRQDFPLDNKIKENDENIKKNKCEKKCKKNQKFFIFIEFVIFIISIFASILLSYFNKYGFIFAVFCNIISLFYFLHQENYFLVIQQIFFSCVNISGIYKNF